MKKFCLAACLIALFPSTAFPWIMTEPTGASTYWKGYLTITCKGIASSADVAAHPGGATLKCEIRYAGRPGLVDGVTPTVTVTPASLEWSWSSAVTATAAGGWKVSPITAGTPPMAAYTADHYGRLVDTTTNTQLAFSSTSFIVALTAGG